MVVRLRLARHGTTNNPFYHLVAIRDKAARDARPIEKLGEYDPIPRPRASAGRNASNSDASTSQRVLTSGVADGKLPLEKRIEWNTDRIKYWLGEGAQPSKPVARLLDKAGLIPEGKWYKGIYRPSDQVDSQIKASPRVSPSAILQAAGGRVGGSTTSPSGTAATPLKQEEMVGNAVKTNPRLEANRSGAGEATMDQAA
ncbi:hypothetical protein CBS101457_004000 [Exobasidium rhododendri]|nr:hypothetical protein CBS101457_004000 [Exobasidium rhododendri]